MNNKQFNYQLIVDYNRTFGTKLCPESKYSIATLTAMKKKLNQLDKWRQSWNSNS